MTLEVRDVTVRFGDVVALEQVSLRARADRITAVIGPPGAGKSVLLKAIAGLNALDSGAVRFGDASLADTPILQWQRRVGMAFQNDALFDAMTVFDNVAFPLRRRGVAEDEVADRVHGMLEQVGLAAARDKLPAEISGGMRKRCGIARAVVVQPSIGLFDDPTAGLDPETSDTIFELIVGQARDLDGVCVIVSNELPSLLAVADDVHVLHEGRAIFSGDPDAVARCTDPVVHQFVRGEAEGPL